MATSVSSRTASAVLSQESPIIGGDTVVNLTSAKTLASLGITVTGLGSTRLSAQASGGVSADFRITGGTDDKSSLSDVILHQGSGLQLATAKGTVGISDFRIDTLNGLVFANATINGAAIGNYAVFALGPNGALTFTPLAASGVDQALGVTAITTSTQVGIASTAPVVDPFPIGTSPAKVTQFLNSQNLFSAPAQQAVIGGDTAITLTSAKTLESLGVTVKGVGLATVSATDGKVVADFPITGGTDGPGTNDVLLHQGSGIELSDKAGTITLTDFVVDLQNGVVDANVKLNGFNLEPAAVFKIGAGASLTFTPEAAGVVNQILGTKAITSSTEIGIAAPKPVSLPASMAPVVTASSDTVIQLPDYSFR